MKNNGNKINKDFNRIFYREEGKELSGKGYVNLIFLVLILIITFLAIGFANGSLRYLKTKMDDPFIKWVNIDIPYTLANQIPELINFLNADTLKSSYFYNNCEGFNQLSVYFFQSNSDVSKQFTGRTINIDNQLFESILSPKNLIDGHRYKNEFDIGLVVTEQLLEDLGYTAEYPSYIRWSYPVLGDKYLEVPLPVVAVVRDLPGNNLFACTPYFFKKRISQYYPFDISSTDYSYEIRYFVEGEKVKADQLMADIYSILKTDRLYSYFIDTLIIPDHSGLHKGWDVVFQFNEDLPDAEYTESFNFKIIREDLFKRRGAIRIYKYDLSGFENESYSYDNLSVNFRSLDRIREFSSFLFTLKNLKIDMSQIESKENYNFVSKLTIFISGFLVIFSVISIILFLSNILKVHINKIKSNLGTFKAFGLSNQVIVRIYSVLTIRFLFLAIFAGLTISILIGETGLFRFLFRMTGTVIDESNKYFNLLSDIKTYFALAAIILVSLIVLPWNIWKMLNKTPGDLIYKRD